MPPRLTFLIRDLGHGGAQRQLVALALGLAAAGKFAVTVLHFYPGAFEKELRKAGIATICIGKKHRWDLVGFFYRLLRAMRASRPQIIHGYLNEGNLMALLLRPFCGWPKVVWGLRDSQTDAHQWGILGRLSFRLNLRLSHRAALIVANSQAGKDYYTRQGYPAARIQVVPNGIDERRFCAEAGVGSDSVRREWVVAPHEFLFGVIGRLNPMKDHATFIRAAALVAQLRPNTKFVILGDGGDAYAAGLRALAQSLGIDDKIIWSPARQDMPNVYAALDALISSSAFGEGFSNVLGEAMACGLPCIATDVGDSAWLLDAPSRILPAGDEAALAQRMLAVADFSPEVRLGISAHSSQRIRNNFTVGHMIDRTASLLTGIINRPQRVAFIITGLGTGGAEMMLWQLITQMDRTRFEPSVISLTAGGKYADLLAQTDVSVQSLDLPAGKMSLKALARLCRISRRLKPDVLVGWMYHGCLAALLAKMFLLRRVPVVWSIRQSLYSLALEKRGSALVIRALAPLSLFAHRILYNSKVSAAQHAALGYRAKKAVLIPNGYDAQRWRPLSSRAAWLDAFAGAKLVGRFGRYTAMKDYPTFLEAAALILQKLPQTHFLLAGTQVDSTNTELTRQIAVLGIADHVHLLGERNDLPELTASLDLAVSSSAFGEGFPNVVAEAMACAVPVVATDIGDTPWVLGDAGKLVPPRNAQALADACIELLQSSAESRTTLGQRGRQRIEEHFSLAAAVKQFETLIHFTP